MDDFFKLVESMMRKSARPPIKLDSLNLKECLVLLDEGWKVIDYQSVPKSLSISVIFSRENQQRNIQLTLREQKLWMELLEKRKELKRNAKSI